MSEKKDNIKKNVFYYLKDIDENTKEIVSVETIRDLDTFLKLRPDLRNKGLVPKKEQIKIDKNWELKKDKIIKKESIVEKERLEEVKNNRLNAYRDESDPLFFQYKRGEATKQHWLDKVEEIRQRFPK